MNALRRIGRRFLDLTSLEEAPDTWSAFRVLIGLIVVYSLGSIVLSGWVEFFWIDVTYGGGFPLPNRARLIAALGGNTPAVVWTLVGVGLVGGVCVTLGAFGKVSALLTLAAYHALVATHGQARGGYDAMLTNALWLFVFSDTTATFSLDCRRRTGAWTSTKRVMAWPRYVIIVQLVVIYTATGIHKLSPVWTPIGDYSALYWVFQEPTWRRFDMGFTAELYPLTQIATAITWHWELSAPLLLLVYAYRLDRPAGEKRSWLRRLVTRFDLRKPWAAVGVLLHLGILVLLNVGPFSWVSLAFYVCLLHPDELRGLMKRLGGRGRLRAARNDAPDVGPKPKEKGAQGT